MTSVLRAAWLIAMKDLRVELRHRELLFTVLFFAIACVLVFAFALTRGERPPSQVTAGVLWVTIAFAGTLALGRTFERERQSETLRALLLAPIERTAVYLGKLLTVVMLLLAVVVVLVPLIGVFFGAPILRAPLHLAGLILTGVVGFAAVGTLFAAMLLRLDSRDVLLPVLLYPMTVPVIVGGVLGTAALFAAEPDFGMAGQWLTLLVFFDAVFLTVALWTFAPVMTE